MSVIDDYAATLRDPEKAVLLHLYTVVREAVPDATEETYYAMPSFKYKGQGLVAIMANKAYLSLYPFCDTGRLGLDLEGFAGTKGSIHFTPDRPVPDDLLRRILAARIALISASQ